MKERVVNRVAGNVLDGEVHSVVEQLSDREIEIFEMMGDGFATHEIAEKLHLSMKTVASHRENIKRKLRLKSGEELNRFAIHWGRFRTADLPTPPPSRASKKK